MKYKMLSETSNYMNERVEVASLNLDNYISTENMMPNKGGVIEANKLPMGKTTTLYKKGDVLISNIRPYFKKIWYAENEGGCSNDVLVIRANKDVDSKFLYYVLSDDAFFEYDTATSKGTKMPRGDKSAIMQYQVPDLSIESQREIASTLTALDNRIDENKKINHHLGQMAHAIFKSWFIDFEPFGGEMPANWTKGGLTDIANYLNGLAMQRFRPSDEETGLPVLKIKELRQGNFDVSSDLCSPNIKEQYIIQDGDVIFSWSGSLLVDFWTGGVGGLNQHLFKVSSEDYDKWFYFAWTQHHLEEFVAMAAARATTMGHIKRDALDKAEVLIPNATDYKALGDLLEPIYNKQIENRLENRKLTELRDSLLPKLLSGEIPVT